MIHAKSDKQAIRAAIKGAAPVKSRVVAPASRNGYDQRVDPTIEIEYDNGQVLRVEDIYCGESGIEGGMPRRHVTAVGLKFKWAEPWAHGEWQIADRDPQCRLSNLGEREQDEINRLCDAAEAD